MTVIDAPDLEAARRLLAIPYCPHTPRPKQAAFLLDMRREALYGGAAAGGKSDALLMGALQFIQVPHYSALILRRTFTDLALPGALMDRARDWLDGSGARWSDIEHTWHFPNNASITFGYIKSKSDRDRYRSAELQYVAFDELTQFPERRDYLFLFSRLRKPAPETGLPLAHVPLRMRAATNPGGEGHVWVRRRFIEPWQAWVRSNKRGGEATRPARSYHPATLDDLQGIVTEEYADNLTNLDSVTFAQMRHGDWDIRPEGRMFSADWFRTIERHEVPDGTRWVRYWDLAATDPDPEYDPDWTVGALLGRTPDGMFILGDIERFQASEGVVESTIRKVAEHDGVEVPIRMEQEPGASGKLVISHFRRVLAGFDFHGGPASGSKIVRAQPVASQVDPGRGAGANFVMVKGSWNEDFLDEIEMFPDNMGKPGIHDDQVDAVSGAFGYLTRTSHGGQGGLDFTHVDLSRHSPLDSGT